MRSLWNEGKKWLQLIGLNLLVTCKSAREYAKVVARYYSNREFRRSDLALLRSYLFNNPYKIHKRFLQKERNEVREFYGESYLTTFSLMMKKAQASPNDLFVELGAGRGRNCFWTHAFIGCEVIGIEQVPFFVEKAEAVVKKRGVKKIRFLQANFLEEPLPPATLLYLDATLLTNHEIVRLISQLMTLPQGARLIGVNFPLIAEEEPPENQPWERIEQLELPFLWGSSEVALFRKISS